MLQDLVRDLARHPAVRDKAEIHTAYQRAEPSAGGIPLGDDCAAIPDGEGHLLFAAEGMLESFVADDPWFAGYSAVMVNLSDVAAMGGRPLAITDVLWTPEHRDVDAIWEGMQTASQSYQVPIVGGHTTLTGNQGSGIHLAASVLGRAGPRLLTSFDAKPGDDLVLAIDMNGAYPPEKPFWNASTRSTPEHLQRTLELLPELAESGNCEAAKDISNGGIVGTLAMFCHCSKVGAHLDLDALPRPSGTPWIKWLTSFPSYGYLLAANPIRWDQIRSPFESLGITVARIGRFTGEPGLRLTHEGECRALSF